MLKVIRYIYSRMEINHTTDECDNSEPEISGPPVWLLPTPPGYERMIDPQDFTTVPGCYRKKRYPTG